MKYFLDTNICIYALKGQYPVLNDRLLAKKNSDIGIPAIVKAELYYGAMKSNVKNRVIEVLEDFLSPLEVIDFDSDASKVYAEIRSDLERKGTVIGPNDLIIAATTLSHNATLVTANDSEFSRVNKLAVENWTV